MTSPHYVQVRVREIATGRVFDAPAVDARELVEHPKGEFEYAPDASLSEGKAAKPVKPAAAPKAPTAAERLTAMSDKEIKALAKKAGIAAKARPEIEKKLAAAIKAGTVTLDAPKLLGDEPKAE